MTKDEALELALEALERVNSVDDDCDILSPSLADAVGEAIDVVKEALAQPEQTNIERHEANVQKFLGAPQPEQEPFAYVNVEKRRLEFAHDYVKWDTPTTIKLDKIPLYTTPPQRTWVGLSKEQLATTDWSADFRAGALWAEAKLKQKNGYAEEKNT